MLLNESIGDEHSAKPKINPTNCSTLTSLTATFQDMFRTKLEPYANTVASSPRRQKCKNFHMALNFSGVMQMGLKVC